MNLRSPAFGILFTVTLVAAAGNMALQSVLPAIGREFGLSDTLVSAAFAISALMWTVASPFWARLSDTLGRKRVMLVGLAGFAVSQLGFGLAASSGPEQWLGPIFAFILMAVARTVYGVFGAAAPIASQAYVADRTTAEERTQAMSLLASAQGLGTVVGPALAPFFVLPFVGLAGPMYVFSLLGAVVLLIVWRRLPSGDVARIPTPSRRPGDRSGRLWMDPRVRGFMLYGLLVTSAQAINISVLGFHIIDELTATGAPPEAAHAFIGLAMFAGAVATLLAQWGLIPLLKLQPRVLMPWGAALALAGNVMSIAAPGYYGVVIGYAVVSMGVGLARPGFTAGSSLAVKPSEQGAVAGLMMSLAGLSFLAPPVIGVALYEAEPAPFIANAVLLVAAVGLCRLSSTLRTRPEGGPGSDPPPSPAAPPASQPGPEGSR